MQVKHIKGCVVLAGRRGTKQLEPPAWNQLNFQTVLLAHCESLNFDLIITLLT